MHVLSNAVRRQCGAAPMRNEAPTSRATTWPQWLAATVASVDAQEGNSVCRLVEGHACYSCAFRTLKINLKVLN